MESSTVIIIGLAKEIPGNELRRHRLGRDRDRDGADAVAVASLARFQRKLQGSVSAKDVASNLSKSKQSQRQALLRSDRDQGDDGGLGDLHRLPHAP